MSAFAQCVVECVQCANRVREREVAATGPNKRLSDGVRTRLLDARATGARTHTRTHTLVNHIDAVHRTQYFMKWAYCAYWCCTCVVCKCVCVCVFVLVVATLRDRVVWCGRAVCFCEVGRRHRLAFFAVARLASLVCWARVRVHGVVVLCAHV